MQAAVDAGFLADYSQTSLNNLKGLIEARRLPFETKLGVAEPERMPVGRVPHLAACQLHQTAAAIRFLAERDTTVS
jgi:hypothetical protein